MIIKKVNSLLEIENCGYKSKFIEKGLKTEEKMNLNYMLSKAIKEIIFENFEKPKNENLNLENELKEKLNLENGVVLSFELEEIISYNAQLLKRFLSSHYVGRKILTTNVKKEVTIPNIDDSTLIVDADMIIQNGNQVEVVKIKRNAPELSEKARKEENKPKNSLELYFLFLLGKELFPNKRIVSSLYHLKNKKDKTNILQEDFEEGNNVISIDEYNFNEDYILDKIEKLINKEIIKTKNKNECYNCPFLNLCNLIETDQKNVIIEKNNEIENKKFDGNKIVLNEGQSMLVNFEKGIARVNAGAGSGKTTSIALRYVNLLKKGYKPKDILLITFTQKAKEEMLEKILFWLKYSTKIFINQNEIQIYTFNSYGHKILKNNYNLFGFNEEPVLATKTIKYDIITELIEQNKNSLTFLNLKNPLLNLPNAKGAIIFLDLMFQKIKSKNYTKKEFMEDNEINEDIKKNVDKIFELYEKYNSILKERKLIEYADQIYLLNTNPDIVKKHSYKHIMIDEFQDTDVQQLTFVKNLIKNEFFESLVVVGDDSQSIYAFRNANKKNIINFKDFFENVIDINIIENHRSTSKILNIANNLNNFSQFKVDKMLVSTKKVEKELTPILYITDDFLTKIKLILDNLTKTKKYSDIAIICRTNQELQVIKEFLDQNNIPATIDSPEKLLDSVIFKLFKTLTYFVNYPLDEKNTMELILLTNQEIKNKLFKEFSTEQTKEYIKSFVENELKNVPIEEEEKLKYIFDKIKTLTELEETNPYFDFFNEIKELNFKNTKELLSYLLKMEKYKDDTTIEKETVKLNTVHLITAHSSKGKEYEVVIGVLNNFEKQVKTNEDLEEERNLLFVLITRAKSELYLINDINNASSRLMYELTTVGPENLIVLN